jgi:hypothetical protein
VRDQRVDSKLVSSMIDMASQPQSVAINTEIGKDTEVDEDSK